jgi:hypothetical protein
MNNLFYYTGFHYFIYLYIHAHVHAFWSLTVEVLARRNVLDCDDANVNVNRKFHTEGYKHQAKLK